MILDLIAPFDPVLRNPTEKFNFNDPQTDPIQLAKDLTETMLSESGLGLSANQCGIPYSCFVMKSDPIICVFNPMILDQSSEEITLLEGCLSFPDLYVKVKRPRRIKVRYTEPNGNVITTQFDDMTARVFLHEFDHLGGLVMQNRANRLHLEQAMKEKKRKERKYKLVRN